jgi:predicted TIM-barrel fold metal-dependent hydrolase
MPPEYNELFPEGSVDLSVPSARVKRLDTLGTDAQVLFTSFWLNLDLPSAALEAALMRSWNRWMADRTADSDGRLLWAAEIPFRLAQRAISEMEFAREHGAVAIRLSGLRHGIGVADQAYWPLYETAQDLGLVVAVHTGGDRRRTTRDRSLFLLDAVAPVAGAWYALCCTKLPQRFPGVTWAFLEAGASWLPFVAQEASRADDVGRTDQDWRESVSSVLVDNHFFVSCQIDDDLPYLLRLFGGSNIVHGTDYSHMDKGSDPYGLHIVASRSDLNSDESRWIVDSNARRLWGIEESFNPAPAVELRPAVVGAPKGWTAARA